MSRRHVIVLALVVVPVAAAISVIGWHFYRLHDGFRMVEAARGQIEPYGGYIDQMVRDGDFYVGLENTNLDDSAFQQLASKFRRFPPPHLDQKHRIEVYAGNTRITDKSIMALQGLPIGSLDVHGTAVTDETVPIICEFELWQLDLRETNITDASVSSLSKLNVFRLGVSNSKMTDAGIKKLRESMPNTQIQ